MDNPWSALIHVCSWLAGESISAMARGEVTRIASSPNAPRQQHARTIWLC